MHLWRLGSRLLSGISGLDDSLWIWNIALTWSPLSTVGAGGAHSDVHLNPGVIREWNFFPGANSRGELEWRGTVTQGGLSVHVTKKMREALRLLWGQASVSLLCIYLLTVLSCSARFCIQHASWILTHTHTHIYTWINSLYGAICVFPLKECNLCR